MPRKPEPPPIVEIVYDTSVEAERRYLDAIRFLVHRIRDKRAAEVPADQFLSKPVAM